MDMSELTSFINRRVMRVKDDVIGYVIELGNYDEDDDLEFKLELENGEVVYIKTDDGFEGAGFKFI